MSSTAQYKQYVRENRVMTVEELFNKGMLFTDAPLDEGYVKALVNYKLIREGTALTPRGGLYNSATVTGILPSTYTTVWGTAKGVVTHHTGMCLVDLAGDDAVLRKYTLIGLVVHNTTYNVDVLDLANAALIVENEDGTFTVATNNNTDTALIMSSYMQQAHKTAITTDYSQDGLTASLEGNTYVPVIRKAAEVYTRSFGYLHITLTDDVLAWNITDITPKEIQPSQAINYGYNMLKTDPYAFSNTVTETGALILTGVIPKDKNGTVVFTSKVGEEVVFHLNYQYPTGDASKQYYVQWEMNDLTTSTASNVVQSILGTPTAYTPGNAITLAIAPSYKSFSLVVKVYYKDVIDAFKSANPNATQTDIDELSPIKSLILASYYLTADNNSTTQNATPRKFDLTTATGMCTWQQRLILWGVANAKTTLFVSEPNAPNYMPYPNNVEVFTENIVAAIPYMGKLLVFTYNKLYSVTLSMDGLTYTTKCIQDNLIMTDDDSHTIRTVRNMVYFRSNSYFYMVVPNNYAGAGELQLAPISTPVTTLLDNFKESMTNIIDKVYNIAPSFNLIDVNGDTYDLALTDYCNYLDGDKMRNIYKWKISITKSSVTSVYYLDTLLIYDTVLRVWHMQMYQSNAFRIIPYEYNVADATTLVSLLVGSTGNADGIGLIKQSVYTAEDVFALSITPTENVRVFPNYQMIDTGYRKHSTQYKKRFREIQFTVNNVSHATLDFYTAVYIDDDTRKDMYTYNTTHITDKTDPNYGLVFVEREMTIPNTLYGETLLSADTNAWHLDFSKFPDLTVAKVSFKISGKGYNGKLRLLSKSKDLYEILTTNWVYRMMYGR